MARDGGDDHRVVAGRLVTDRRRKAGFWLFLVSNALWVVWGLHSSAPALIALQVALAAMNIRGAMKTDPVKPG
jgi:hypothetical protein